MIDDSFKTIRITRRGDGAAVLTLARPDVHNAFNEGMIAEMTAGLAALDRDPAVRLVILAAEGKSFSAGADLDWMRRMATYSKAENLADAGRLAELMRALNGLAKPSIARVQGAAFGGGVGLVSCCDIAVAVEGARFALSEVSLGLIPAVISPYVIAAIGARAARRWFLTGERFDADEAGRLGLIHRVVPPADLDAAVEAIVALLLAGPPGAQAAAKELIFAVADRPQGPEVIADTARRIAERRATAEGREGVAAFLEKRAPNWGAV
jgi:methylglutaconyl-CoA hydratase